MAVTANQLIAMQDGDLSSYPVAATIHHYQGTLAFVTAAGYSSDVVASGANVFAGIVITEADNSSGSSGDINVELYSEGDFELTGSGFSQATVGEDIYASDNYTVTTSNSSTSFVGECVAYVSSTRIMVRVKKQSPTSALASSATGTTGLTFTVDTDAGKPRIGIMSQTGGTGDFTAFIAPPATLTADRTFTLAGDADATLVGVATTQTLTNKTLTSPTMTAPVLGVATGTSLAVSGLLTSSSATAGIGYATGAGGTVTQITNRSTGVTLNKLAGAITTDATSLAAGAEATFTVTNSTVAIGDVIVLSARSGQTAGTSVPIVTAVAAGSFDITLTNLHASTADTGAMVINFAVIKSVSA